MRFRFCVAAVLVALTGTLAMAQKMTTPEELDDAMKKVQPAMMAANKALKANNFAEARTQLGIVKKVMNDSREFWVQHKREDALKFNSQTVAAIEATEKLMEGTGPDPAVVAASVKELGATCASCHKVYRERDADNNWILKPGSIGN